MAEDLEAEPLAAAEPPLIDLFMTVVKVADWWTVVRWYTDTLGLATVLVDRQNEFALLAAGQSRVGLQGMKGTDEPTRSSKVPPGLSGPRFGRGAPETCRARARRQRTARQPRRGLSRDSPA